MSDNAFLAKSSLITFLGGLGIYGIGLTTGRDDVAVITLIITTVVAFVLALTARRTRVGKVALCLTGAVLLLGTINYVMFRSAVREGEVVHRVSEALSSR